MPEPTAMSSVGGTPTPPAAGPEELSLVLFGLPAAGKSSLLGALGESAQSQEHLLGGRLVDRSGGLDELRRRLYDESPRRTAEEVFPYPVRYEPFATDPAHPAEGTGEAGRDGVQAVLMDCDGRVANDLLLRRQTLDESSPEGTLAREVVEAETLILVVDAAAPPAHLDADFTEFDRFLRTMEQSRGARVEVGGLPVFLVLTKCDLLAQPGDTPAAWMDRIEQRKRDVDTRFRTFLARDSAPPSASAGTGSVSDRVEQGASAPPAFGWLDVHVWATAVKRPPLAGVPARPREPYGVAELFRQCLDEAVAFRTRSQRSGRRLALTVIASVLLVLSMVGLAAGLFALNRSSQASLFQERVDEFRFLDSGTPAERLRGDIDRLREKQARLQALRDDPLFDALRGDRRDWVERRLAELKEYITYWEALQREASPGKERTEEELERKLARLRGELAPPRADWADTLAGRLHDQYLQTALALQKAVQTARNWYLESSDEANRLWTFAGSVRGPEGPGFIWANWTMDVERLLDPNRKTPFKAAESIPGVPPPGMTWATALRYDRVVDARAGWEADQGKLRRLLDVCSALGLATPAPARPAVLVFSRDFTLAQAKVRAQELKTAYPEYRTRFVLGGLSEAIVATLRQAARNQYRLLLQPARVEILRQLRFAGKGREETLARWEAVRDWLRRDPDELSGWRALADALLRLAEPTADDPIKVMVEFLNRRKFTIEVRTLVLEVPDALRLAPRAEARLVVLHPASERQPALAFELSGSPHHDAARRVRTYTFRLAAGTRLVYRPGDKLWAELSLSGETGWLMWSESRSQLYQFERLRNPPRQQPKGAKSLSEGRLLDEVRLTIVPEDGVPIVPDLMPAVRLEE